jgi:hypothetical protein
LRLTYFSSCRKSSPMRLAWSISLPLASSPSADLTCARMGGWVCGGVGCVCGGGKGACVEGSSRAMQRSRVSGCWTQAQTCLPPASCCTLLPLLPLLPLPPPLMLLLLLPLPGRELPGLELPGAARPDPRLGMCRPQSAGRKGATAARKAPSGWRRLAGEATAAAGSRSGTRTCALSCVRLLRRSVTSRSVKPLIFLTCAGGWDGVEGGRCRGGPRAPGMHGDGRARGRRTR